MKMKNKKAAMEMSVGTIVTIVLLMSVLVLGIFLVQRIFGVSQGAVDLTEQQLNAELGKLFSDGEDAKLVIYPTSKLITVKSGERDSMGMGIKNVASTVDSSTTFSYKTETKGNDCGLSDEQIYDWIRLGREDSNIPIPPGEFESGRIDFRIPEGTPDCLARFRVTVYRDNTPYTSELISVEVKS
jgi:hypothetical protein